MAFNLRPSEFSVGLSQAQAAGRGPADPLSAGEYSLAWTLVAQVAALILVLTFVYPSAYLQGQSSLLNVRRFPLFEAVLLEELGHAPG